MPRRARITPGIPLMMDKERMLYFDLGYLQLAELELERIYGRKINLWRLVADPEGLSLNDITTLLWCGLLDDDASLTRLRVQDLMELPRLGDYMNAIYQAWNAAWPAPAPEESEPAAPLATVSPGSSSGVTDGSP